MRILLHDYGGYAFPLELSRALAGRGHNVLHLFCGSLQNPRGAVERRPDDPAGFQVQRIDLDTRVQKYSYLRRWQQERTYGRMLPPYVARFRPDVVISTNAPLDAQRQILAASRRMGVPFIFWIQDLLGVAASRILGEKLPIAGALIGRYYERMEARLLKTSDHVVTISTHFSRWLSRWHVAPDRVTCVPNWAPLDEVRPFPKRNAWSEKHGLADRFCFLYSGNLGRKHNPARLVSLAQRVAAEGACVVVVSEGLGAAWLREQAAALGIDNLLVLDFQPYEELPAMLGAADVLVALLEPDAAAFSVPSKVLTYLCAERALLLAVPASNPAAQTVREIEAGVVIGPEEEQRFIEGALRLLRNDEFRRACGSRGRAYAERAFAIQAISDKFDGILAKVISAAPTEELTLAVRTEGLL
jgi:glycosyltransferase involved in cell wall biosynthesis